MLRQRFATGKASGRNHAISFRRDLGRRRGLEVRTGVRAKAGIRAHARFGIPDWVIAQASVSVPRMF